MATTYNAINFFTGDGETKVFAFSFPYLSKEHVKVTQAGTALVQGTDFSITDEQVTLVLAPATSDVIKIYRETPTSRVITWSDGNYLLASNMTVDQLQTLYILQEIEDYLVTSLTGAGDFVSDSKAWAQSTGSPDDEADTNSATGKTQSSRTWALESEDSAVQAKASEVTAVNAKDSATASAAAASLSEAHASTSEISAAQSAQEANISAQAVQPDAYDASHTYNFPDLVVYTDGNIYRCIGTNVVGQDPDTSALWSKVVTVAGDFFIADTNGDLMPSLTPMYSNDFDLDTNNDIMPKELEA